MYAVIGTDTYLKEIKKWPKQYHVIADKIPKKLADNPNQGDQLRYPFLRESRIREKRVYYLIYDDLKLILLIATSGKKDQKSTIDHIADHLDEFRKVAEDIAKQVS
jgi:mRNA-degrading endonuclease RelE of RelBE toxin-antitoxin system|tara:strand:+ start:96 stop:413 length:318 start_codon:yes stop_codon:yes gene_type:complete